MPGSNPGRYPPGDQSALVIGREGTIHLNADSVGCVDHIMLKDAGGKELKVDWKPLKPTRSK